MPRPTKLTDPVAAQIESAVRACASYSAAALHAGVSERSFHAWMSRGRQELERLEDATTALEALPTRARSKKARAERMALQRAAQPHKDEVRFLQFLQRIEVANADATVRAEAQVALAGSKDWRAAAWLAERRDRDLYGQTKRVTVEGSETGPPIQAIVAGADDRETADAAHEFLRRLLPAPEDP